MGNIHKLQHWAISAVLNQESKWYRQNEMLSKLKCGDFCIETLGGLINKSWDEIPVGVSLSLFLQIVDAVLYLGLDMKVQLLGSVPVS